MLHALILPLFRLPLAGLAGITLESIAVPVGATAVLALVFGTGLALAAKFFQVPGNEKQAAVRDLLPGANCGACGYAGCDSYAEAVANGEAIPSLCTVGGQATTSALSALMGVEAVAAVPRTAWVMCNGKRTGPNAHTSPRARYVGLETCAAASLVFSGDGSCTFGCVGLGDCIRACPYDAIDLVDGIAVIRPEKCRECELCVAACPKKIIYMIPRDGAIHRVQCRNPSAALDTRKVCSVGCIGCGRCTKVCPSGAIRVEGALASINQSVCTHCGACFDVCPTRAITRAAEPPVIPPAMPS